MKGREKKLGRKERSDIYEAKIKMRKEGREEEKNIRKK